jgi:hypothetical protein
LFGRYIESYFNEFWKDEDVSKASDCGKAKGFTQFKYTREVS